MMTCRSFGPPKKRREEDEEVCVSGLSYSCPEEEMCEERGVTRLIHKILNNIRLLLRQQHLSGIIYPHVVLKEAVADTCCLGRFS